MVGWAYDPDAVAQSIDVHAYVSRDGNLTCIGGTTANVSRKDVDNALHIGEFHGFDATFDTSIRGAVDVQVVAINVGEGSPKWSEFKDVTVLEPKGNAVSIAEDTYSIRSKLDTSMCLDVAVHSQEDKANVWLYKWNTSQESGPTCEKFQIKAAGDGSYYIIATHSNKAVEVTGAYTNSGANVAQYTQNQSVAQRWFFDKNSDGTYTMRQRNSGMAMDVTDAKTANGTNIQQCTRNGSDAQKFYLVPIDASKWSVSLSASSMTYTGSALEPEATVNAGGVAMKEGTDYAVSYKNNVNAGTATVIVAGKGGFTGSNSITFEINAAENPSSGSQGGDSSADGSQDGGSETISDASSDGSTSGGSQGGGSETGSDVSSGDSVSGSTQGSESPAGSSGSNIPSGKPDLSSYAGAARLARFTDLADDWYLDASVGAFPNSKTLYLDYAVKRGLMSGYSGTKRFGPDDAMSRAMVATVVYRMATGATADEPYAAENTSGLSDVEPNQWYTAAVNWCVENKVITGYTSGPDAGRFCPGKDTTREELATITGRYCTKVAGMPSAGSDVSRFSDKAAISGFAREGVAFCAANKIVGGYTDGSGRFDPQGQAKRCQGAKIFAVTARLLE